MIKQANTILQKDEFENLVDKVHLVKDDIKTTFAEALELQEEIKKSPKG